MHVNATKTVRDLYQLICMISRLKLLIFLKICCFLHWIQSVNPIFMLPYIIMDLPIFVIAEWATLLVDIRCPRGGS